MKKHKLLALALVAVFSATLNIACEAKKAEEASTDGSGGGGGGGGGATIPEALKDRYFLTCDTMTSADGALLNGKTNTVGLELNADGTFDYTVTYSGGTGCANGRSDGSDDNFDFFISGVYQATDIGSDKYEVTLTVTSQTVIGRTVGVGPALMNGFNSNCPGLNLIAGTFTPVDGVFCGNTNNTNYIAPSYPLANSTYKQTIEMPSSSMLATVHMGSRPDHWSPGLVNSFPAVNSSKVWKVWQ